MAIPETQLDTWAKQGSVTQSSQTYNTIKSVLEQRDTPYFGRSFEVFLQGSYGNDTNIYAESDVDIVIQLNSIYSYDSSDIPSEQKQLFSNTFVPATYELSTFRDEVVTALQDKYGSAVAVGEKAVSIAAGGGRRKADVIIANQYRRYQHFGGLYNQRYVEGICFYTSSGQEVINYPKKHAENLTARHRACDLWLKPVVRILKNLRGRMVDKGLIEAGTAPSYYIEGLLYNVPPACFKLNYAECLINSINWIVKQDRSDFRCANEQYYLLREGSLVTWRADKCQKFLDAVCKMWEQWGQ